MTTYTPGWTPTSTSFMARRSLASHGGFLLPHLASTLDVLDLGCGPGTITCDVAAVARFGSVVGVDRSPAQVAEARRSAAGRSLPNVSFQVASADRVPLADASVDVALAHALLEHVPDAVAVTGELWRVLRPGGTAALCSPDWGGFLLAPDTGPATMALARYRTLQETNGGDTEAGRKLGGWLSAAGFGRVRMDARYEVYPSATLIAAYLAEQLAANGYEADAGALMAWADEPSAMFAQCWCSAVGHKS